MTSFLVNLLSPIFYSMGVSKADLTSYIDRLSSYIIAILILLVAMIVVMVAAHKAKKGVRHVIRWQAGIAFVAIVAVLVNVICYGPMYNNVSSILNAKKVELAKETTDQSRKTIQKVGEEGMVLLKNDGILPLASDTKKLNVFGWDSTNPLYGGTGSGSSDSSTAVGILQSLKDAGYKTNKSLTKMYTDYRKDRPTIAMAEQDWTLPEPTKDYYTDSLMKEAKDYSDTAVVVIGRSGGEGADLPTDMKSVIDGSYKKQAKQVSVSPDNYGYVKGTYKNNGDYDDFDEGESYLELSNTEEDMLDTVCSQFDKVIVVVNANNAMELDWVDKYEQIGAVIFAPGAGATGFEALGEIINGSVNPSGKTADTFVKDLQQTPYYNNMGMNTYTNVDDLKEQIAKNDSSYEGSMGFVNYAEGIYVGYKFYETAAEEGKIQYEDMVQYPFGYGLSYTSFDKKIENFKDNGDTVTFDVTVKNTGDVEGKDVVELYYTAPYTNGGIEKASANLLAFEKTDSIKPGKTETKSFTINKEDMASYDSEGIKVSGGGYILEAGEYTISLRSDSHTVVSEEKFTVDKDIDYSKDGRSSDKTTATNQFEDYARGDFEQLSRKDGFANYDTACGKLNDAAYEMSDETRKAVESSTFGIYDGTKYDDKSDKMPKMEEDNGLQLADLVGKSYDDKDWDKLLDQLSFDDMSTLINVGGWQTAEIKSVGKIATSDCDGPAGLNNFITKAYGTAYPSEVLIAQTWNKELANEVGDSMGQEYVDADNYGWYGPAMNIHRSAFAGRNFEYYSEDSVLSGYMAANEINGAAAKGVYPYIKHFALNDQETNRCSFLLTYASEQTIREGYLKAFELAVKGFEGKAMAAMSSFNWIGTVPSCANNNLLNNVLRGEWGFTGMVETDYDGSYGYMITDHCIRNGNDLMLGFNSAESNKLTDKSATAVLAMRQASKNILYTVANSGYYADGNPAAGMSKMTKLFVTVDVILAAILIAADAVVIVRFRKKRKKSGNQE